MNYATRLLLAMFLSFACIGANAAWAQPGMPGMPAIPAGPMNSTFGADKEADDYTILNEIRQSFLPTQVDFYIEVEKSQACVVNIATVSSMGLAGAMPTGATEKDKIFGMEHHEYDFATSAWVMTSQSWSRQWSQKAGAGPNSYSEDKMYWGSLASGEGLMSRSRTVRWDFDSDNEKDNIEDLMWMPDQTGSWEQHGTTYYHAKSNLAGVQDEYSVHTTFAAGTEIRISTNESYSELDAWGNISEVSTFNQANQLQSFEHFSTQYERAAWGGGFVVEGTQTVLHESRIPGTTLMSARRAVNVLAIDAAANNVPVLNQVRYKEFTYDVNLAVPNVIAYDYIRTTSLDGLGRPLSISASMDVAGIPNYSVSATWSLQNGMWKLDAPWTPATYNADIYNFARAQEEGRIPNGQSNFIPYEMDMMMGPML